MSGRYGFVARLRRQLQLYKVSKSTRNPFNYLFGRKSNPNKIRRRDQFDKNFIDEIEGAQSSVQSEQWSHSGALQEKWTSLKNVWFKNRIPQISGVFQSNDITSDYLSQHLLSSMDSEDDDLRAKWVKFTKRKLFRLGNASMNNKMEIYHRGELFFEQLWSDIASSEEQILMETYIMEPDAIAIKTIQLLTEASLRGVSVVLIVDSFGSSAMNIESNPYLNELRRAGAVVLEYNKVKVPRFFEFIFLKFEIPYIFWYRNHKKIIVIDDAIGYTGGMNMSGEYCGEQIGGSNKFRDTHTRLEGDIVRYLKESLYFSVLDMNPTVPPLEYRYQPEREEEEDDTDLDSDIESDAESEVNEDSNRNSRSSFTEMGNTVHTMDDVEITELDPKRARREVMRRNGEVLSLRQRLFPTQMLPAFLKNFNSYRKRKKLENENHRNDHHQNEYFQNEPIDQQSKSSKSWNDLSDIGLSEEEETILYGRKQRWRESWKQMQQKNPWTSSSNAVDEHTNTQQSRLKILASTPRKSLSEWMKYYEGKNRREEAEAIEGERDIQRDGDAVDTEMNSLKPKPTPIRSALEVSALSKLMAEAKQTNNFTYHYHMRKSSGMDVDDSDDGEERDSLYLQVLESYRDKRFRLIQKALMSAIDNAESHVYIMNPYFLPPVKLKRKLRKASARGVEVRVITCDQSDVPFISMASRHIYEELLSNDNIRLFEYEGDDSSECANILHGKMCIIDNVFVSLGSFNWDDWSYTKNLEMNLMIVDDNVGKSVHDQFIIDQTKSKEIKLENVRNDRSLFQKCMYSAAYYIATIANRIT